MHQEITKEISPKLIFDEISKTVIGQSASKKAFSNVLFMHYANLMYNNHVNSQLKINNNFLLMGPSGNGKTLMINEGVKALNKLSGINKFSLLNVDCTSLSAEGWMGNNLSALIGQHIDKYKDSKYLVVYFDEFDKLCMPMVSSGGADHHRQMQYALLTLLEGTPYYVQSSKRDDKTLVETKDWLFVFSGNFFEIRKAMDKIDETPMGFTKQETTTQVEDESKDLFKLLTSNGLATQVAGRISKIIKLDVLTKPELNTILVNLLIPKFAEIFSYLNYGLHIPFDKMDEFIELACHRKTGARGLNASLMEYLEDITFEQSMPVYDPKPFMPEDYVAHNTKQTLTLRLGSIETSLMEYAKKINEEADRLEEELEDLGSVLDDYDLDPNAPEEELTAKICMQCVVEGVMNDELEGSFKVQMLVPTDGSMSFFIDTHGHEYPDLTENMILCDNNWEPIND